jgi:hypothetical protein
VEADFDANNKKKNPDFFYHLGDVVYLYGDFLAKNLLGNSGIQV